MPRSRLKKAYSQGICLFFQFRERTFGALFEDENDGRLGIEFGRHLEGGGLFILPNFEFHIFDFAKDEDFAGRFGADGATVQIDAGVCWCADNAVFCRFSGFRACA